MPKGKGSRKGGGMDRPVFLPFRVVGSLRSATSSTTPTFMEYDLAISNLGARAGAVASTFEYFRFSKLRATQTTTAVGTISGGLVEGLHALSYVDSNAQRTGSATTLIQMAQYEIFKMGGVYDRLNVRPRPDENAATPYKWYNTASTGAPSDSLSPGMFIACTQTDTASAQTFQAYTVIEGVIEFRGMITPALQFPKAVVKIEGKEVSDDDVEVDDVDMEMLAEEMATGMGTKLKSRPVLNSLVRGLSVPKKSTK